jgi:hypothetical protein
MHPGGVVNEAEAIPVFGKVWTQVHERPHVKDQRRATHEEAITDDDARDIVRVHDSMRSPDAIASRSMVRASRCIRWEQLDGVLLERPQQQRVPDRALLERGAAELGTQVGEFRLLRASVPHPAYGACIVADWPLPTRA